MIKKPRQYGSMKISRVWLVVSVLLAGLVVANVMLWRTAGDRLSILDPAPYGQTLQNNRVIASKDLGLTFLGTYQNEVLAIDAQGDAVWSYPTASSIEGVAYDDQRALVIAGLQGRMIAILNARDGTEVRTIPVSGRIYAIDYDEASGEILVSAAPNAAKGTLSVFSLEGEELLKLDTRPARDCAFAPDGTIVYGDARANVIKMDRAGSEIAAGRGDSEVYAVDIARDTGEIVVVTDNGQLLRLDSSMNTLLDVTLVGNGRAVAITDDGGLMGVGTREGDVYLLDDQGVIQFSTRLSSPIAQIVIDDDQSFVVPLSTELYTLDVSAAESFYTYTTLAKCTATGLWALPLALALTLVLTFGRSRSLFFAFFASLYRHRTAYLLLLPSFALILVFNYLPTFQAFFYAFTDWNQMQASMRDVQFVGFDNFVKMVREGYFLLGVKNMLIMMGFHFLKLIVPLLLAELVFSMSGGKRRYWYRFLLVLPMVVPGVVSTLMWKNIYDPTIGLINQIFTSLGRPDLARSWLGSESTALGAIIFMGFPWVNGFAFLVFYGGLINIPGDLFEAARVDGSTPAWNLTRIHLPLITPQIKMIIILTFISSIQDYSSVLLLTGGGPGYATYVPGYELYLNAQRLGQYGYACALGVVMFIVILGGTILNMRMRTEEALG